MSVWIACESFSRLALDYEIGVLWRPGRVDQVPHDLGGSVEGNVAEDLVRLSGWRKAQEVLPDRRDFGISVETRPKLPVELAVELNGDDVSSTSGQLEGEQSLASAYLNDQVACPNGRLSDEASGERPALEKVLG